MTIIRRIIVCALLCVAAVGTANGAEDPASRLLHARSLRCIYTSKVATWVKKGHRTVEQSTTKDTVTYDNIDLAKGTARVIGSGGAFDLTVWVDQYDSLRMLAGRRPLSVLIVTVFPVYAEGTDQFVVLESDHWLSPAGNVLGTESYGTCVVSQ